MEQRALLDHQFVVAAYTVTWVLQLGYLAWLGMKWRAQIRDAARTARNPRESRSAQSCR
jgi:threonine/homoserine/homoserine lactone efflux protein